MIRITDILEKIAEYSSEGELEIIERAYVYSARVHDGQLRLNGEPYLSHPLEVANILADMNLDAESVAAGLLHDVVEDTHATVEDVRLMFGDAVSHIVSGVTKLSKLPYQTKQDRQAENFRKMILAMADDIRVILIKLADRLHNMRTLQFHHPEKRKEIAQETLEIYAPIASRLGIYWIKNELEDISFKHLYPEEYARIQSFIAADQEERDRYVEKVKGYIQRKMDESGLSCEVLGRYKHFYSIYNKMESQNLAFEDVYDIIAFRIILDSLAHCYEALGLIHALWRPIPTKFKDYIASPKPNMYQSLHTTVIGPFGERVEIQIRTHEMDRVAKSGIAAHWGYKEGKRIDQKISQRFAWIQDLVEHQEEYKDPNEFLENVRIDLFPDEVYVFTPDGEVKSLPKGATPVDYAYLIHTEVGNQCVGAKVNGRMMPLKYELVSGDIVEILTKKGHHPSKDWLNFVKTVKARSRIRQWIKVQEKERSLTLGREMCEKAFRKYRLNFSVIAKTEKMEKVVAELGFKTVEDLIASVGYGKVTPLQVIRKVEPKPELEEDEKLTLGKFVHRVQKKKKQEGIIVQGMDDILIKFGKCCQPVPGDQITGYITRGYGVTVHRANCINALKMSPERQIDVQWSPGLKETYPVRIAVHSYDRVGLLADLASTMSKNEANILKVNTETHANNSVDSLFTITVQNTEHLDRILSDLKKIKLVQHVRRIG